MAEIGSINDKIADSVSLIAIGRDALHTESIEAFGRVNLNKGIMKAKEAFKEANTSNDIKTIIQAELTFVNQELLNSTNRLVASSFEKARIELIGALDSYKILSEKSTYPDAERTYLDTPKYRYQSCLKMDFIMPAAPTLRD
jgi:hypothetical protein